MRSDLVKKVKIPPWPDTETTQSPDSDQGTAHETAGYRCFVDFSVVFRISLSLSLATGTLSGH